MSLAKIRDEYRVPARPGVWVTIQHGPYAPTYRAEIIGSRDDWVRIRTEKHDVRLVHVEDITFPGVTA